MVTYAYQYVTVSGLGQFIRKEDLETGFVSMVPVVEDNRDYRFIIDNEIPIDPEE